MIPINKRLLCIKESGTLQINKKVKSLRKDGRDIVHFGFGQSPFSVHPSIAVALKKHAHLNHYIHTQGLLSLREHIAHFLREFQGIESAPDRIFIAPGSKEFLFQSILLLDAEFIVPKGSWVSYLPQIKSKGAKYHILDTKKTNDYKVQAETLDALCKLNRDYVLILNSPNNPTGAVYSEQELKQIANVCKKYGIVVLSDEIYSQLCFFRDYAPSIRTYLPEQTLVFGGLSKVFSAGGYRLGFLVVPPSFETFAKALLALISESYSCVAAPIQYAAIEAYRYSTELQSYIRQQKEILSFVGNYVTRKLKGLNLHCSKVDGGFYTTVDFDSYRKMLIDKGIKNSEALCDELLNRWGVALLPGADFCFPSDDFVCRLAFVDFEGDQLIDAYQSGNPLNDTFIKKYAKSIPKGIERIAQFVGKPNDRKL